MINLVKYNRTICKEIIIFLLYNSENIDVFFGVFRMITMQKVF